MSTSKCWLIAMSAILVVWAGLSGCNSDPNAAKSSNGNANDADTRGAPLPADDKSAARNDGNQGSDSSQEHAVLFYDNVYALCIGIDEYRNRGGIRSLRFAVADAKSMAVLFRNHFGYRVETLLGPAATKDAILRRLTNYQETLGINDALLVFFAGHGQDIELHQAGRAGFLIPFDAELDLEDTRDPDQWNAEAMNMHDIGDIVQQMQCRHVLFLADACHSGYLGRRSGLAGRRDYQQLIKNKSRMVITAGMENQEAQENPKLQHGVFTFSLMNQLEIPRATSATEVFVNLRTEVSKLTNGEMVPQLREFVVENGEFVFVPKQVKPEAAEQEILALNQRRNEQTARRTKLEHVFEAFEALDYRFAADAPKKKRQWEAKFKRFQDNASLGDALAMAGLHYCYSKGLGTETNETEAYNWARRAFDSGHLAGKHVLGRCYFYGIGVDENARAAHGIFEDAADKGFPMSQFTVGATRLTSDPTDEEKKSSLRLLGKATESGLASAERFLGSAYVGKLAVVKLQIKKGVKLLESAANKGLPTAQLDLYDVYSSGRSDFPDKDLKKAHEWLRRAAEAGHPGAQLALAREYYHRLARIGWPKGHLDLPESNREARHWAKLAASQGSAEAHVMLAHMYQHGDGGEIDLEAARKHCETAANSNHPGAISLQGCWYLQGTVYPHDEYKAFTLLKQAARMGDADAMYWCGQVSERGLAGTVTKTSPRVRATTQSMANAEAAVVYLAATRKGHEAAQKALNQLTLDETGLEHLQKSSPPAFREIQRFLEQRNDSRDAPPGPLPPLDGKEPGQVRLFRQHGPIGNVGFLPNGKHIFTAGSSIRDPTIRIWELHSGREIRRLKAHLLGVQELDVSKDGRFAVSCASPRVTYNGPKTDLSIRLWDLEKGREVRQFVGHEQRVNCVAFSPDGKFVLSGGDDGEARLWNVGTGKETRRFEVDTVRGIERVLFEPDGKKLWTAPDLCESIARWDSETGNELAPFPISTASSGVTDLSACFEKELLVSCDTDEKIYLWHIKEKQLIRRFIGHTGWVASVALSSDGQILLSGAGGHRRPQSDYSVRLWDVESGKELHKFEGHTDSVESVAFSPDGRFAVSGSFDGTARVWRLLPQKD